MLIYNYQKEFIGIDESDLKTLGFSNLSQLRAESADFADLFVRTPGFIHNFKHVHWIDFIACADPAESSKVIINVNAKTFKATISIETVYLTDSPTSKAYLVQLNNLKTLSSKETENISTELSQRSAPVAALEAVSTPAPKEEVFVQEEIVAPEQEDYTEPEPYITQDEEIAAPLSIEMDEYDLPEETPAAIVEEEITTPYEIDATPELSIEDELQEEIPESIEMDDFDLEDDLALEVEDTPVTISEEEPIDDNYDYDYTYDPQVASDELGLPIDLIEEFIQDFIAQATEFKDELYSALEADDIDNVKILSHKLKGVAANLRIEDAFDTLTVINTSSDSVEIKSHIKTFYKIIAKLSGEEIKAVESTQKDELALKTEPSVEVQEEEEYDLYQDHEEPKDLDDEDLGDLDLSLDEDINLELTEDIADLELELDEEISLEEVAELKVEEEISLPIIKYSKEQVASEIGLDTETFNELFTDFITESESATQTMSNALEEDNFAKSKQEAIKLKGMSENMRVNDFAKELDVLIGSSDKNEMIDALKRIKTIIEQISK